jgi:Flp pilus assembly pilin Flp
MLEFVYTWIKDNIRRQEGQTMAEYGIILALITVGCIVAIGLIGGYVQKAFNDVVSGLKIGG